jgi:tetratricopeptide (TPR) repeat protein
MTDFIESLSIPSDRVAAYLARGYVYLALKDYQKALDTFQQALEVNLSLGNACAYQGRGLAYFHLKKNVNHSRILKPL